MSKKKQFSKACKKAGEAQIGRDEAGPKIDRSFFAVNETDNERERRNKSEPATSHIAMRFRKSNP